MPRGLFSRLLYAASVVCVSAIEAVRADLSHSPQTSECQCVCKSAFTYDPSFSVTCRRSTTHIWNTQGLHASQKPLFEKKSVISCEREEGPPPGEGYSELSDLGFYKLHTEYEDWEQALRTCAQEGANLAVVDSDAEAAALRAQLTGASLQPMFSRVQVWVAVSDLKKQGEFVTAAGVPIKDLWARWAHGEPNNKGGNEHCVSFDERGLLNDFPCDFHLPFFCERRK